MISFNSASYAFPVRQPKCCTFVFGKFFGFWLGIVFLCLLASAHNVSAQAQPNSNQVPASAQSANAGRQLFESVCAGCHGLDGRGGERGPDISTRPQIVQLSDAEILEILRGGRPAAGMPPFDSLGSAKLQQRAAYLRALQGKSALGALPGDPRNGKVLFFGKARCSECHTMRGSGGFLGRDLSTYGATLSPAEIRSSILHPDPANRANKTAVVTTRDSQKFTGVIRNEDNFSIQLQSLDGTFHFLTRSAIAHIDFLPQPIMPADYATALKPSELDDLVSFIISVSRTGKTEPKDEDEE
jgi:cytochrome c oxidase cbb3-type subunit III